jgi:methionyl-tRNA synthetase
MASSPVLVTAAPPNPNGDLHLGHLAGPFLGADVLTRYLRQRGRRVLYASYTDDLSPFVLRKAEEIDRKPEATAYLYGRRMEQTLSLASMLPDYYEHPFREPIHVRTINAFFQRLWQSGKLEVGETSAFYCARCRRYLYEAHVRGRCQFCAAPSDGFYCEECALPQEPAGLRRCIRCDRTPKIRRIRRIVFPLDRHADALETYYASVSWRPRLLEFCHDLLRRGLPPAPISRLSAYGARVPLPGWRGHILDTWYSGICGYIAATRAYAAANGEADSRNGWWDEPSVEVVHFIGFDCSFSHAVLWPALLIAHGEVALPRTIVTNEFYRLEGEKFSTSRGHAIWGADFLRDNDADLTRLYLCLTNPESEQTSFARGDYDRFVETIGPRLRRIAAAAGSTGAEDRDGPALAAARRLPARVAGALEPEAFSLRAAAAALVEGIEAVDAALSEYAALPREVAAAVAAAAAPVLPRWTARLWSDLGLGFADAQAETIPWPAATDGEAAISETFEAAVG